MNRRDMLKAAGSAAAISILGGIPLDLSAKSNDTNIASDNRKKILVIGGHPDDPETAAGHRHSVNNSFLALRSK